MNVLCIIYVLYSHEYAVNKHMHICMWGSLCCAILVSLFLGSGFE